MTRRDLLALGLSAPVAALLARSGRDQGLGTFAAAGPPACDGARKLTPAADDHHFRPGSPARASLLEPGTSGRRLSLSGAVVGIRCGAIKGAVVDVWQADARGVFDAKGFRLRGHQTTDENGRYHVETIEPGAAGGRARHLGIQVRPPGKPSLTTLLFFSDDPAAAKDPLARPELIMKVAGGPDAATAVMDLVLDL